MGLPIRSFIDESGSDREGQLVDELWVRAKSSLPAGTVVILGTLGFLLPMLRSHPSALIAYVVLVASNVVRWIGAIIHSRRRAAFSLRTRYGVYVGLATLFAAAMGVFNLESVRYLSLPHLSIWVLVVSGICGGATLSIGARPEVFFTYIALILTPLIVAPLVWPREGGLLIAVASFVWTLYSVVGVRQYFETRKGLLVTTNALDGKLRELERARQEMEGQNRVLSEKNQELVDLHQRADRIFAALAEALPGKTLAGKYLLEDRIGAGGFAVVFRATHLERGGHVAVKIFRPQSGNDSAAALERFGLEGMSHALLNHPNIVQMIDAGMSDDGIAFIVMELLEGQALAEELSGAKRIGASRMAGIGAQVCHALGAAHAAGIIHRDVKPENIFLHRGPSGETVKLLDFGIAKLQESPHERAALTMSGVLIGSPPYMAPERLLSEGCDASADIYSVGLVLYRGLAGRLPFEGSINEIMMHVVANAPPPLHEYQPDIDRRLESIVMRALSAEPSFRPTATEMATELRELCATSLAPPGAVAS